MNFEFATATRILFGPGTAAQVPAAAAALGARALVVTGGSVDRHNWLFDSLEQAGVQAYAHMVKSEPDLVAVRFGVEMVRSHGLALVIGVGGGSPMDAAKAIAALAPNAGDVLDYLEVIGGAKPLDQPPLPCIAIPTTAGTGAEVTRNAVIGSPEHGVKVSLRGPHLLPQLAVVDPQLTLDCPSEVTAASGFDALTQLLEAFVSRRANPLVDSLCREGLFRANRSLWRACEDGRHEGAREDMALASLLSGLALANAGLGAVHGFAGVLGGRYHAPHGAICARLCPSVAAANIAALRARDPASPALKKYAEAAVILTGHADAIPEEMLLRLGGLRSSLTIPPLSQAGMRRDHLPALVEGARRASSMKSNPVDLTEEELLKILEGELL